MEIHRTIEELEKGLEWIQQSPRDGGRVEMIVLRPGFDERVILAEAELSGEDGLVGDDWRSRGSSRTPDHSAHPEMQIAIMNSRALHQVSGSRERWSLAGDQLVVDLDVSQANLKPGDRLLLGQAELEITGMLHAGCDKFAARFGRDALRWVNSRQGRDLRLRGVYARVVQGGQVRVGDEIKVVRLPAAFETPPEAVSGS